MSGYFDWPDTLFLFIVCLSNLVLSLVALVRCIRSGSPVLLFWLVTLYVAAVPLVVDSTAICLGYGNEWSGLVSSTMNYIVRFRFDVKALTRTALFVFCFNSAFCVTCEYLRFLRHGASVVANRYGFHGESVDLQVLRSASGQVPLSWPARKTRFGTSEADIAEHTPSVWLFLVSGWIGMFGMTYMSAGGSLPRIVVGFLSVACTVPAVMVYVAALRRRYVTLVAAAIPCVFLAYWSTQRPFLVPILSVLVMATIGRPGKSVARMLFRIFVIGTVTVVILVTILVGRGASLERSLKPLTYPVVRDNSTNILYYVFDRMYDDPGTSWRGIQYGVGTGVMPESLGFHRPFEEADIPHYVARHAVNWREGSLHPTIYGWSYVDMHWWGIIFAIMVGIISHIGEILCERDVVRTGLVISCLGMFYFVAGRGSVQYGIARSVYTFVVGYVVLLYFRFRSDR